MGNLKEAGIIDISQGKSGITLVKKLDEITFYDVYKAVDCVNDEGLFHFHENPSPQCPVGKNIHALLDDKLKRIQTAMEDEMRKYTIADLRTGMQDILAKEA